MTLKQWHSKKGRDKKQPGDQHLSQEKTGGVAMGSAENAFTNLNGFTEVQSLQNRQQPEEIAEPDREGQ